MKLLFAIKRLQDAAGGAERVLANVTDGLVRLGHEVTILTFDRSPGTSFYPLNPKINLIHLPIGNPHRKSGPLTTILRISALRRKLLELQPDVAIGFMHSMFIPLGFAMIRTGIPVIASEHTVPKHYHKRRLEFLFFILSSFFISRITVISENVRNLYPLILKRRMIVMPNPVKLEDSQYSIRHHFNAGPDTGIRTIINISRLTETKKNDFLIRAFHPLAEKYPNWHLRIVGHGEERRNLENLARDLGLEGRVHLPGVTRKIVEEYRKSHIFATPSLYESFGLSTAEAMTCGLPAAGFADCPGTNELIIDGENGILVKDRSIKSFSAALEKLMTDEDLRKRLGENGKRHMDLFSTGRISILWEKLLKETLRRQNRHRQSTPDTVSSQT